MRHVTADGGLRDQLEDGFGTLDELAAEDIAELIAYTTSRPKRVNLRQIVALSTRQV